METAVHNALTYIKARDLYSTRNRDYSLTTVHMVVHLQAVE